MTKLLIDTNVLIYAMDENSPFNTSAALMLQNPNLSLHITTKNISEFFSVCTKLNVPQASAFKFYYDLKNNATVLFPDTDSLRLLEVLLEKYNPKGNRVFDMEIVSIMLANGINKIATFNTKDFVDIDEIELLETTA
jgi:predicted nucleic acid-binding protein